MYVGSYILAGEYPGDRDEIDIVVSAEEATGFARVALSYPGGTLTLRFRPEVAWAVASDLFRAGVVVDLDMQGRPPGEVDHTPAGGPDRPRNDPSPN